MKRIADFIVEKRVFLIVAVLIITVISGVLIPKVNVNTDMTKYLPDNSSMKIGMDKMDEAFPEAETDNTIRVMYTDLDEGQKLILKDILEKIPNVTDVDYDDESEDYNRDKYTKYVLHMEYDYGSPEEQAIFETLDRDYAFNQMTYMDDSGNSPGLPLWVMIFAVCLLMIILIIMSGSWFEPLLFLFTIASAVVINLGSNLILGTISENTFSVTAILQLVLSMDYSIILINRYRQELENTDDRKKAMKAAVAGAFSSISSSSITTVVGLLALVFMSFKIGFDMGVVLAKGVFLSVVCVFLMLPGLILTFSKAIEATAKPVPNIPTGKLASFGYKGRIPLTLFFIGLFAGAYVLHKQTVICFSMSSPDIIADIFPTRSTVVMLYDNEDEETVTRLAEKLEDRDDVKSAVNYANTIGEKHNPADMVKAIDDLSESLGNGTKNDFDADESMFRMLYYKYFGYETADMTAAEFMRFITEDVIDNKNFRKYMGDDIKENASTLERLSSVKALKKPMNAEETADFFEMETEDAKQLLLYYFIQNGGAYTDTMTISEFTNFVLDDLAKDPEYADMFDEETLKQIKTLSGFTDETSINTACSPKEIAEKMGIEEKDAKGLFVYYYGKDKNHEPKTMTIKELVNFLKDDVAKNPDYTSYFTDDSLSQIEKLSAYTDKSTITAERDAAGLAQMLGMEESAVRQIFKFDTRDLNLETKKMSMKQFYSVLQGMMNDPAYSQSFDPAVIEQTSQMGTIIELASSGTPLPAEQLGAVLGMDSGFISQLFMGYSAQAGMEVTAMPLKDFVDFLVGSILPSPDYAPYFDEQTKAGLYTMQQLCTTAASGAVLDMNELSQTFGMEYNQVRTIFILFYGNDDRRMSLYDFVKYLNKNVVTDPTFAGSIDADAAKNLAFLEKVMGYTYNITGLTYKDAAALLSMEEGSMKQLYVLRESQTAEWKMTLKTLVEFLCANKTDLAKSADPEMLENIDTLKSIMDSASAKEELDSEKLAKLVTMEKEQADKLTLLYTYKQGNTSEWKISAKEFIDFLISDVLGNKDFADKFDDENKKQLNNLSKIINAVYFSEKYDSTGMAELFGSMSEDMDENTVKLLFLYHDANINDISDKTMSITELMSYLSDVLIYDETFGPVLDDEMKEDIKKSAADLRDCVKQLKGDKYSRLILSVTVPEEGPEAEEFYNTVTSMFSVLKNDYHLIGSSAMNYEMSKTFDGELLTITLLTALAIFLVVLVTFRNAAVPAILVLLVQCGVYITVSVIGIQGYSIHYLALLIVQCILMGSTIDYAILFSTYYRECRKTNKPAEALKEAFSGSMHTILTSGLIMVTITGILGQCFGDPTVEQICQTISIGAASAIILIIFILPGILTCLDRFTAGKDRLKEK